MSKLVRALEAHGPQTSASLRMLLNCSPRTASRLLLHAKEQGFVYVCRWERQGEREYPMPVYALGSSFDAEKPDPKSATEYQRKWRAKRGA